MNDKRQSWDTAVKHLARNGVLYDVLTSEQISSIPSSNLSRWRRESENKYQYSQVNEIIKQEIDLIKRINQSSRIKKINQSYFKLCDTFHLIISNIKGIKTVLNKQKEILVNTIEHVKDIIPIDTSLKAFNISRSTFENYKSILIHKCNASYFKWCTKRFVNQLLSSEVEVIKKYMTDNIYKHWSKSSIYLKALREGDLHCCISTFYKYCRLLGYKSRCSKKKSDFYSPVKTSNPNQLWCADVTIFKTSDGIKHYIHFLIDHYSKIILGYRVENSSSASAIKELLQNAYRKYKPEKLSLLTDGGSENVNVTVSGFINSPNISIKHIIAQKDVAFSNSMVEALNKTIKHQFLYPLEIVYQKQLINILDQTVLIYNTIRPQMSLAGNTPQETFDGIPIDISQYTQGFKEQKQLRLIQNQRNSCKVCL